MNLRSVKCFIFIKKKCIFSAIEIMVHFIYNGFMSSMGKISRVPVAAVICFCLFIIGGPSYFLWPLDPDRRVSQYAQRLYTASDGLPQNAIQSIIQTHDGYLWFGTQEGAARFDGNSFFVFNRDIVPRMNNEFIYQLYEDREKRLWFCTRAGVLKYENGVYRNYTIEDGLSDNTVLTVAMDKDGAMLFGTGSGVNRMKDGKIESLDILAGKRIEYIYTGRSGATWIGAAEGLGRIRDGDIRLFTVADGLPVNYIKRITEDSEGHIWLATQGGGVVRCTGDKFSGITFSAITEADGLVSNYIRNLLFDRAGNFWVASSDHGLNRVQKDGDRWQIDLLDSKAGLSNDHVMSLYEDVEGNIWVGTQFGLNQLRDGKLVAWTTAEGLSGNFVTGICSDQKERLWISCYRDGLNYMENGRIYKIPELSRGEIRVMSLCAASDGHLWIGTNKDGLFRLKHEKGKSRLKKFSTKHGLSSSEVWSICEDRQGNIWLGTKRGLNKLTGEVFVPIKNAEPLRTFYIYCIKADKHDNIWAGSVGGGLARYRDGQLKRYTKDNGMLDNIVMCLHIDRNGILWAGTSFGLHRLDPDTEKFTVFTTRQGLFANLVFAIVEDHHGYMWMSSNKGVSRIKKEEMEMVARGEIDRVHAENYVMGEGLKNAECNGGFQPAGWVGKKGNVFFSTSQGLLMIEPGDKKRNRTIPPVYITGVTEDAREVPINAAPLSLGPGVQKAVFHFTALSYSIPRKVAFKIKLEGFDRKWEHLSSTLERNVYYHKLPPGDYTFRVKACNNDGLWNEKGASLHVNVKPYMWQTLWFKILAGILFALLSYLFIHGIRKSVRIFKFWKKRIYIGKYRIDDKIAAGGMGTIYRANETGGIQRKVALKVLREEFNTDEVQKKRFKQEGAIIDRIQHPHIINVIERGEHDGNVFIAMELLNGHNLGELLEQKKRLKVKDCIHILKQVTDGLREIHKLEIVHRDIKPENIMLIEEDGDSLYVKVLDFGLARDQSFSRLTQSGMLLGTISYLAPEQIKSNVYSKASDIYSLGVVCYEMLTGIKPFPGDSTLEVMGQILGNTPIEPRSLRNSVPQWLNMLVLAMMAKEVNGRPTVDEVWDEIAAFH